MSDDPERQPRPVRRSAREWRQVVHQGMVSWDDVVLSEGQEAPETKSPDSDPDFQRSNLTDQAGAARPGHRRQETAPAPEHYPSDIQDARSPPGPDATRPPRVQGSPPAMEDGGGQDPLCDICGDPGHDQDTCLADPNRLQCDRCHKLGHTALVCPVPVTSTGRQPLSELGNPVPSPPGDALAQQGAVG